MRGLIIGALVINGLAAGWQLASVLVNGSLAAFILFLINGGCAVWMLRLLRETPRD